MKNPKEEAERWFAQADFDLKEAETCLVRRSFAYACFFSEQSAQKFIKGFLILNGERFVPLHSIKELLEKASTYEKSLKKYIQEGQKLDRYYLITRYPDALPTPSVPFESYGIIEAKEAVEIAQKIKKAIMM